MTEKLYYEDSHTMEFTAQVVSCAWDEKKHGYGVILTRTAFFPEGGGQYADPGVLWLAGNLDEPIPVTDVQEAGDEVVHFTKQPLEQGAAVKGSIDYPVRFSRMQQHTGEHIVSGLVHGHFGYDNVGFHLGDELVTMDFNGSLTQEQIRMVELEANQAVSENLPVIIEFPSQAELEELDYRSKKELTGRVRIVTIPGYDVCACCAPHVSRSGEIGIIKLIDAVKYKGGTRVTMVCGFRALKDYQEKEDNVKEISRLLSAKPYETAEAVKRLQGELQQWKDKMYRMQSRYLEKKLQELRELQKISERSAECPCYLIFEGEMDRNAARKFVDAGMHCSVILCGIFIGNETEGYQYILGSQSRNLREDLKQFHDSFEGKGGGKPEMVQGTVRGKQEGIAAFWNCLCK